METKNRVTPSGKRLYTLSELQYTARIRAIAADVAFSQKFGFIPDDPLEDTNLYFEDGKLAGITCHEHDRWETWL